MAEDGEPAVHGYCIGASVYITDADTYFKDYVQHNDKSFNIGVKMRKRKSDEFLIVSTVAAMKEKLIENSHKPDLTKLPLDEAIKYMKGELWELIEELHEDTWDYKKIRRELADVVNFAGAAICACDRVKGVK